MINFPLVIPEYQLKTDSWTEREFSTKEGFLSFVNKQLKIPGEYDLKRTDLWRQPALHFQKNKTYTLLQENTEDYRNWWKFEKTKTKNGVIYNLEDREFYVTGDYYWFLNFTPIVDKVKGTDDHAEVWDGHYHLALDDLLAELYKENHAIVKARQKGISLYRTAQLLKGLWFVKNYVGKMLGYEEDFINEKGSWRFLVGYRNHLNEHTPWYRNFEPDESMHWEQKQTVIEGDVYQKKKFKGLKSKLVAATTKKNVAKAVGGGISDLWCEEFGIAPNGDKVIEYAEAATKLGGIKTGNIRVGGAVGELKDCKPLEDIAFNPEANGFRGVEDVFSDNPQGKICFFFPDYWNYITEDNGVIIKCYDEDGNSNIKLAKEYLLKEEENQKKKGEEKYRLWKSQHPWSLQDAFAVREDNPFPADLIKEHQTLLIQTYKPLTVELKKEGNKLKHHFIEGFPVRTIKVDPNKDNRGCIEVFELPINNPPWGLYYAGVDPIVSKNTTTSKSLQSITIFKAAHYVGDKLCMDYPVAWYTGRHPKWEDTYRITLDLIQFYNARTCVENNVTSFIEWMIKEGESKWLMRRKEVVMVNEFVPTSSIRDEIGIRMEGELKKKALQFVEAYLEEIISTEFEEDGTSHYIYGVSRIKDIMLLEEFLKYSPRLNTDRCFPKDTKILTPSGYKLIQDITCDEEVVSADLSINKVFQKHVNPYKGDMYNFRIVGQYNNLICTEEHPILVGRYTRKPKGELWNKRRNNIDIQEYIPAKDVKKGDKVFIPKRKLTEDFGLSKEFLYIAGWIFGDGYLSTRHKGKIQITLGGNEEHLAKQLVEILNSCFPNEKREVHVKRKNTRSYTYIRDFNKQKAYYKKYKFKNAINVIYHNKLLYDLLVKHTGTPHNKFVSHEIFNNINNLYFVAGCYASDGHLKKGKSYDNGCPRYGLELTSVYETVSQQIRQMLLDNNIWCTLRKLEYSKRNSNFQNQYKLEIQDEEGINRVGKIFDCYPKVEYSREKRVRFFISDENGYWVSVKEVNKEHKEIDVYNIAVENTNTYIAENIAVHNCISFMLALMAARSNTNRNIIVDTKPYDYTPKKEPKLKFHSQFITRPQQQRLILPSQFKKN